MAKGLRDCKKRRRQENRGEPKRPWNHKKADEKVNTAKATGRTWRRIRHGSVTIYLSLVMVLVVSLLLALFVSVQVQAGRAQTANGVDQAMFSFFARYDRELMEKYDVFFVDGTFGGTGLDVGACRDEIRDAMAYILEPGRGRTALAGRNLLDLEIEDAQVNGYTLATDVGGEIFAAQAIAYMKDTAGIHVTEEVLACLAQAEAQSAAGGNAESGASGADYDACVAQSAANQAALAEAGEPVQEPVVPADFENPIPIINRLRKLTVYSLVIPDEGAVSKKTVKKANLLSGRRAATGIGIVQVPPSASSGGDRLIFNEYALAHCGNFTAPQEPSALTYQTEYILGGKYTDEANLKAVIRQLLLIREGANFLYLSADAAKQEEIHAAAAAVAALLLLPEAEPVFAAIITAGWAFAESLVDVRALLSGKRVAVVKDASTWQVGLKAIKALLSPAGVGSVMQDVPGGTDYEGYLRILLAMKGRQAVVGRTMDMVESTIRAGGRRGFRLDTCIDAVTFSVKVRSEGRASFSEEKTLSYRDL